MKILIFDVTDPKWDVQLNGLTHDIYHRREYISADDAFRETVTTLYVVSGEPFRLVVPLTLRPIAESSDCYDAMSPYGYPAPIVTPSAPEQWIRDAMRFLIDFLYQSGIVSLFLRLHPLMGISGNQLRAFGTVVSHGDTVSVGLSREYADIRAEMRKSNRYEIRKALREGQTPVLDKQWDHFEEFYSIYKSTMNRLGASSGYYFSREYFFALRDNLPENVFLWTTKIDGTVAAASLITECEGIVQYHLSGTHPDFSRQYPTKVLLDAVAEWANDRGNTYFHLGGGLGGENDSLFAFKAGFGKGRHTFSTVRIIVNPEQFQALVTDWETAAEITADDESGFFPAYRKPRAQ